MDRCDRNAGTRRHWRTRATACPGLDAIRRATTGRAQWRRKPRCRASVPGSVRAGLEPRRHGSRQREYPCCPLHKGKDPETVPRCAAQGPAVWRLYVLPELRCAPLLPGCSCLGAALRHLYVPPERRCAPLPPGGDRLGAALRLSSVAHLFADDCAEGSHPMQTWSARRRMNVSQRASCSSDTHSLGWCACSMCPGPQMIVEMSAL